MPNEITLTDQLVRKKLDDAGLTYEEQGSSNPIISGALKNASKSGKGVGKPEFIIEKPELNLVLIIEDKRDNNKLILKDSNNELLLDTGPSSSVSNYAVNGAVHYAKHILEKTYYRECIAIGITGDSKIHNIKPFYVTNEEIRELEDLDTFENFDMYNIKDYYNQVILGKKSKEEILSESLIKVAKELHEDLRNYGQVKEEEKPLIVSGILLALEKNEEKGIEGLNSETLRGSTNPRTYDGSKILDSINNYIAESDIPKNKQIVLLNQFRFIKDRSILNQINEKLGMTPLKYFVLKIQEKVQDKVKNLKYYDVLGKFYSEFISYSAGDGKGLGIVITPSHVTKLFTHMLDIKWNDIVLDTCTGTGGFLVSAMSKMIDDAEKDKQKIQIIKEKNLHGIELREDLYSIATTNMILRGDGKSNLLCNDYTKVSEGDFEAMGNITVGMINPPYSQAKNESTRHLSEMNFILGLLERLDKGGRAAAIVPQSVVIGKTKYDKELKKVLLKRHTLEAVITMPKELFYPVGTNTVIVIMTAKIPHYKDKRVKFINYQDDGFIKHKTLGRIPTQLSKDKERYLLNAYFDREDVPNKFMVKSTIEPEDEWLHSFYYFNEDIPVKEDFEKTITNYLAFETEMILQDRGYLFEEHN